MGSIVNQSVNEQEALAWITLFHTQGIGNKRLIQLITYFGNAQNALVADSNDWKNAGIPQRYITTRRAYNHQKIALDQKFLDTAHCSLMRYTDEDYPVLLKNIADPPALLYLCGNRALLNMPQIAIVGTRQPSAEGIRNARHFAGNLAKNGFVITSGLALGIDGIAHQAVLDQDQRTIAVLGTGINQIYPQSHRPLAKEILQKDGLIISEFHNGTPPIADNFPKRNRIIAGLSLGTLVVEAALRSGSLITARLSFEENREVFAIPSSIYNSQAKGCHYLIKQGAKLVESVNEVIDEFRNWLPPQWEVKIDAQEIVNDLPPKALQSKKKTIQPISQDSLSNKPLPPLLKETCDPSLQPLLLLLEGNTLSIDQLVNRSGLESSFVSHALMLLELEEVVECLAGGYYRRC